MSWCKYITLVELATCIVGPYKYPRLFENKEVVGLLTAIGLFHKWKPTTKAEFNGIVLLDTLRYEFDVATNVWMTEVLSARTLNVPISNNRSRKRWNERPQLEFSRKNNNYYFFVVDIVKRDLTHIHVSFLQSECDHDISKRHIRPVPLFIVPSLGLTAGLHEKEANTGCVYLSPA